MGCAVPDVSSIKDWNAEKVIVSGLLRDGRECLKHLDETGLTASDFTFDSYQRLYDLCCYCANGCQGPVLAEVFDEMRRRREFCNNEGSREAAMWLVDVWTCDPWIPQMERWAEPPWKPYSLSTWCALAAAAKVRHLSARRRAVYAAAEVIRDALDPTGDAEYLDGRADSLYGG